MSPIVEFTLEQAEGEAAELQQRISGHEEFLAGADQLLDDSVTGDVRAGKESRRTVTLRKRKESAEAELPELRRRYRALNVVICEEQAKLAEVRRAQAVARMAELVEAEGDAMGKACAALEAAYDEWLMLRGALMEAHSHWRDNRDLVGEGAAPHCVIYPPGSFASFVKLAATAVTSGEQYANSSPLSKWIKFRGLEVPLSLGEGVDFV